MTDSADGALSALPQLLRIDPALPLVLGSADATLAVAAPAQPVLLAALAHFTERSPLLVVTATEVDAVRLADDLACFLPHHGADDRPRRHRGPDRGAGRRVAGVGNVAVRAGEPRGRDHGPPAGRLVGADP